MTVGTAAGTTIAIGSAAPATFNAAGYDALTPTLIGEVTDLGEFGRDYALIKHNPLASRATVKRKGSYDEGSIDLKLGLDTKDAGQILAKTASKSDNDYYFKITVPSGDIYYFAAQVMSFKVGVAGVDNIISATIKLEITSVGGVGIVEKLAA